MRIVLCALLFTGCVSKKRHLGEMDVIKQAKASVETELQLTAQKLAKSQEALSTELRANDSLTTRAQDVDDRNVQLRAQLVKLGEEVARLGTKSASQAEQKAALEAMLGNLQIDAEAARKDAEAAAERAAELTADRERLAEEAARLQAEKEALQRKTEEYGRLRAELAEELANGQVRITESFGRLVVDLSNDVLFSSGSTQVKPTGKAALTKVATVLSGMTGRDIRVEGHTDNVPVGNSTKFADNWQLSSLRASGVVVLLVEAGVDPKNIAAVGYGEHRPAMPNDSSKNRSLNRRTEIVLAPRQ